MNWNLEISVASFTKIKELLDDLTKVLEKDLQRAIILSEEISKQMRELESFIACKIAENTENKEAIRMENTLVALDSTYSLLNQQIDAKLKRLSDKDFKNLTTDTTFFALSERREKAKNKLDPKNEEIISKLSIDGYHGWFQMFQTMIGKMEFSFQGKKISFGMIENKMNDPDRAIRKEAFASIQKEFFKYQDHFATILNHLGGYRLQMNSFRNESILDEPLKENRLELASLNAMWSAKESKNEILCSYLDKKASLLKLDKLAWYDVEAPIGNTETKMNYQEGGEFIVKHFSKYSKIFGEFAKSALENNWVEAEDRKNKQPGGFCTPLPLKKESRIFMTYSGTISNVATLAHELGHAFHSHLLYDEQEMNQHYKMNVAETASTMAELLVTKAAIKDAKTKEERVFLLDDLLSKTVTYLMNIHARFLFEKSFYEERKKGFVDADRLSELMVTAQKKAFGDSLEEYHPLFWAAKMHFYFTDVPFYNFPYTFGYLLSTGLLSQNLDEKAYMAFLQDTGKMTTEDLVKKHLGKDLESSDFFEKAVESATEEIEAFLKES